MDRQNETLRTHALGGFAALLEAIIADPAMLVWLDGGTSKKEKPNENFAREFLELFTLGAGHYTERDIREAARAFTGWVAPGFARRLPARRRPSPTTPRRSTTGPRRSSARPGAGGRRDIVRITLERPEAATFLARKLYRLFVSEAGTPGPELIEPLADEIKRHEFAIGPIVEVILRSRHFYSRAAYRQRIKSPVEFSAGLVRMLEVPRPALNPLALSAACDAQGQELFAPPNVEGWVGGSVWINSGTLLERTNWAADVIWGRAENGLTPFDPLGLGRALQDRPPTAPPRRSSTCCSRATSATRRAASRSTPAATAAPTACARRSSASPTAPSSNWLDPIRIEESPCTRLAAKCSAWAWARPPCWPAARRSRCSWPDRRPPWPMTSQPAAKGRILVVVQLDGGNDGLNTVVPYRDDEYRKQRPRLADPGRRGEEDRRPRRPASRSSRPFSKLLEQQRLAIVQSVGYPNPNRSHFESMAIWQTARTRPSTRPRPAGWPVRSTGGPARSGDAPALHIHEAFPLPRSLAGGRQVVPSLARLEQFRRRLGMPAGRRAPPRRSTALDQPGAAGSGASPARCSSSSSGAA